MEQWNNEQFNIWFAGFFDAEGCISIKKSYGCRINISQTDPTALFEIRRRFGGTVDHRQPNAKANQKKVWYAYRANNKELIQKILLAIESYLVSKKVQA